MLLKNDQLFSAILKKQNALKDSVWLAGWKR
jgi:hypothetical protein